MRKIAITHLLLSSVALILLSCVFLGIVSAGGGAERSDTFSPVAVSAPVSVSGDGNILIAYFTWAENTHVDDPGSVDIDATTSASVLPPGNTALLAHWIQEAVGGDLFSIVTVEPYSDDYDECLDRARREHDRNERPALTSRVENMDDYDFVFLGFPNWWYSCPMAILSFIEQHDFSGKTVIPFCAHGTGGLSASIRDITRALPQDCTLLDAFGAYRPEVMTSQGKLMDWLERLGFDPGRNGGIPMEDVRIRLSFDGHEAIVRMLDNATSASLIEMLPLVLTFEDYARAEKISYPPQRLVTAGAVEGYDPDVGDLACYGPWGNLAVFYQDHGYSRGLIPMGSFESGFDAFSRMQGDFEVTMTLVGQGG